MSVASSGRAKTDAGLDLPPMLSPTLPAEWDVPEFPSQPLSPTLPPQFGDRSGNSLGSQSPSLMVVLKYPEEGSGSPASTNPVRSPAGLGLLPEKNLGKASEQLGDTLPQTPEPPRQESKPRKRPVSLATREYSSSPEGSPKPQREGELSQLQSTPKSAAAASRTSAPVSNPGRTPQDTTDPDRASVEASPRPPPPPEYKEYLGLLHYWVDCARKKKYEADAAMDGRKHRLAALVSVDSVICFIRAFDCEDRAGALAHRTPHTRSWETLLPYLGKLVIYLESVDADIAGMCYQLRALLYLHISNLIKQSRKLPASGLNAEKALLAMVSDFRRGLVLLPTKSLGSKYGLSWSKNVRNPKAIDPETDRCVTPLHVNSTLQDAAALALHLTREWANHEAIEYELMAAQPADAVVPAATNKDSNKKGGKVMS